VQKVLKTAKMAMEMNDDIRLNLEGNALHYSSKSLKIQLFNCKTAPNPYCANAIVFDMVAEIRQKAQI
jgi:hypothetical protein